MKKLLLTLALVMFAGSVQAAEPAKGDAIWAQWKPNAWFHGKVADKCDYGYIVNFDDGDVGCVPKLLMAKDKPMAASRIVPGTRVLAKWSDGNLYPATVSGKPDGGKVKVFFDDRTPFVSTVASLRAIGY
jgi:hypothetical protein